MNAKRNKMTTPNQRTKKTAQLVIAALGDMNQASGTSINKIIDYVSKEYAVTESDFKKLVRKALDRGIAFGAIKKVRGRYTIGDVIQHVKTMIQNQPKVTTMKRRRRSKSSKKKTRRRKRRRMMI